MKFHSHILYYLGGILNLTLDGKGYCLTNITFFIYN